MTRPLRIALVAMPWNSQRLASPALSVLAAFLRERTDHSVTCLHEYVQVSVALGALYEPLSESDRMGELIYTTHLHPPGRAAVRRRYIGWAGDHDSGVSWAWGERYPWPAGDPDDHFEQICQVTGDHIESLAARLAGQYDVCGFTTTSSQLFASLAVARRVKELDPGAQIILGGGAVAGETGASVRATLPFVDRVIEGEGEVQLVSLLRAMEARQTGSAQAAAREVPDDDVDLDRLPRPDVSDYRELVEEHVLLKWSVPIEGSRPRPATGSRPRSKSANRIAAEMKAQCERHENVYFFFVDSEPLDHGADLGAAIKRLGKTVGFFHNVEPGIHPYDLLRLWEAGCAAAHLNIDGLSTSYLRRMGRSTTAIQCLQAMRTCYELGINHYHSVLLTDFPGATAREVQETVDVIRRFAIAYQPLETQRFRLWAGGPVSRSPERFGVTGIRNADEFADALPPDWFRSLELRWLDHDVAADAADWSPVRAATGPWRARHRHLIRYDGVAWFLGARPLYYYDGGTFLKILDRRTGHRDFALDALMRDIYLRCMEITTREELEREFGRRCDAHELDDILDDLREVDLIFSEGDEVLSLAVAYRADLAVARMHEAWRVRARAAHG